MKKNVRDLGPSRQETDGIRLTSTVSRDVRDGRPVYVKQFREDAWEGSEATLRARTTREAMMIRRLADMSLTGSRLGRIRLVDCLPDRATIVTEEASGQPLSEFLLTSFRRNPDFACQVALLLVGRWLRRFQELVIDHEETIRIGGRSPGDLLEYCDIRLCALQQLNYGWLSDNRRQMMLERIVLLRDSSDRSDNRDVWCHGDFAPGNVLWDGRVLTPIDFTMANPGVPLLDVTYFIHRMEMLRVYFPWKYWPIENWKRAFLRGYGRPDVDRSPMYRALMIRHLICRLLTYAKRPPNNMKQKLHAKWIRFCVRSRLEAEAVTATE